MLLISAAQASESSSNSGGAERWDSDSFLDAPGFQPSVASTSGRPAAAEPRQAGPGGRSTASRGGGRGRDSAGDWQGGQSGDRSSTGGGRRWQQEVPGTGYGRGGGAGDGWASWDEGPRQQRGRGASTGTRAGRDGSSGGGWLSSASEFGAASAYAVQAATCREDVQGQ